MAHTDDIGAEAMNTVVQQITAFVDRGLEKDLQVEEPPEGGGDILEDLNGGDPDPYPLKLQDSLRLYEFSPVALRAIRNGRARGDLSEWAISAGEVHHQLSMENDAVAFARSLVPAGGGGEVVLNQLNVSPLAGRIEEALQRIKENQERDEVVAADPVVRLLDLPSYQMIALWMYAEAVGQSRVLIVLAPESDEETSAGRFLTTEQFFQRLRDIVPLAGTT